MGSFEKSLDARRSSSTSRSVEGRTRDEELCSMPIVTKSQAALTELLQITRDCDVALQALYDRRGNPQSQRARLLKAIREAEELPLGPKLWEDPILAEALDELDQD